MARRNPNVSVNIDLEADAGSARKDLARDLDKIEGDAKDTVRAIDRAFEQLSPELDTSEIRKALDLAEQLDGMVASMTIDTDLSEIKQAEEIARSLRGFQGRVDLSVEGREELKDALDLAEKVDQIRQVKVQVQGREDLEKAARLAEDLEQRRTVRVDVDDSELRRAGEQIEDELADGGARGADAIGEHLSGIEFDDLGGAAAEQMSAGLAAAGPWGAAAASIGALVADDMAEAFSDHFGGKRAEVLRGLRTGLSSEELGEVGQVAGEIYVDGLTSELSRGEIADAAATIKATLGEVGDDFDLSTVTRQALALSEVFGTDLSDSVAAVDKLLSLELVPNAEAGFNALFELGQQVGEIKFDEAVEVANEFSNALASIGIQGPQGIYLIGEAIRQDLFPQVDQAGEVFEEFNEIIRSGGAADALAEIELSAKDMQDMLARGDGAEAMAIIAQRLLALPDPAQRAALAAEIYGDNMSLVSDPDHALQLYAQADGWRQVGSGATDAAKQTEAARGNLDAFQKGVGTGFGTLLDGLDMAIGGISEAVSFLALLEDGTDSTIPKLASQSEELRKVGDGGRAAAGGVDELKAANEQLDAALQAFSTRFDEDQIYRRIEEDARAAIEATKGLEAGTYTMATGFDISTEAGGRAEAALEALSLDADSMAQAYLDGRATADDLSAAQNRVEGTLRQVASQMGLNQAQTDALIAKYGAVQSEVFTRALFESGDALSRVLEYQRQIGAIPSSKTTTVATHFVTTGTRVYQTGGGFAEGGPVKGGVPIVVGEEGDELFVPDQDGTIIPHDETEQMRRMLNDNPRAMAKASPRGGAGSGAGGTARGVLEIRSGGSSDFDRFLIDQLRKAVKNRGGIDVVFR